MVVVITLLIVFGLALGSFINALVWRVHQQQKPKTKNQKPKKNSNYHLPSSNYSVISGRSMCPDCRHELAAKDLIPVLSWVWLRGRCRYCKKPISRQYPLVEVATSVVFVISFIFWPGGIENNQDWLNFFTWLAVSVGLIALLVYDARWMLLPSRILYPTAVVAVVGRLATIVLYETDKIQALVNLGLSIVVASGIFLLLYLISSGKWIGFGDVRLGLITGALLASPALSFLMIFLASLLGTIFVLPELARGKKNLQAKLPYGPFLITAAAICLLFGQSLIDWYYNLLMP